MTTYFGSEDADVFNLDDRRTGASTVIANGGGGDDTFLIQENTEENYTALVLMDGGAGNDDLTGWAETEGNGTSAVYVYGDDGDDALTLYAGSFGNAADGLTVGRGGDGDDTIAGDVTHLGDSFPVRAVNDLAGGNGNDEITGHVRLHGILDPGDQDIRNVISGGNGDDRVSATMYFAYGASVETATSFVRGGNGNDRLSSVIDTDGSRVETNLHSELYGGVGNDRLSVKGGDGNILDGGSGADTLYGSAGADEMAGGTGADYLKGRGGEDLFIFENADDSPVAGRDRISDFTIGEDTIDLHALDAKSWRGGNQRFTFDDGGHGGSGKVWVEENPHSHGSLLYADTGREVLVVALLDGRGVHADDYSADDFIL
ncbi:calcium-binding protein [Amaricoccus solimangrovi]|uniref:Calcium-binding protein n=1 Tax=Amaricoccus solimangrovi TaxID=2589815 RepID=A0A501WLR2_9RHOB|nr:calcium-binding protein [Amaricoccus solimangrovi]TPE48157.1 calcium-binding protein [Amaricoccus solimangrovi]